MARIRIVLADDYPALRLGIRSLCDTLPDLEVVGEADDGAQAIEVVRRQRPDVLVLDARMPQHDGVEVAREVLGAFPGTRVLVYTGFADDVPLARALLRLGVHGYLAKPARLGELVTAIRQVHQGGSYLDASVARRLLTDDAKPEDRPTPRELEVLRLVADGQPDREVARQLEISSRTVRYRLTNLFQRLGARSRVEMINRARQERWIP